MPILLFYFLSLTIHVHLSNTILHISYASYVVTPHHMPPIPLHHACLCPSLCTGFQYNSMLMNMSATIVLYSEPNK